MQPPYAFQPPMSAPPPLLQQNSYQQQHFTQQHAPPQPQPHSMPYAYTQPRPSNPPQYHPQQYHPQQQQQQPHAQSLSYPTQPPPAMSAAGGAAYRYQAPPPPLPPSDHHPPYASTSSLNAGYISDYSEPPSTSASPTFNGYNNVHNYQTPQPPPPIPQPHANYNHAAPQYTSNGAAPLQPPPPPPKKVERIDPKQIPRPSEFKGSVVKYYTRSGLTPPTSTSDYIVVDEGNCSPRFMRFTTNQLAADAELIEQTKLSIGAVIQPLAPLGAEEESIPLVSYPNGPIRCATCLAYINAGTSFVDGGRSFVCNICALKNDVPTEYHCHLDANGLRRDKNERFELCRGSVEYVVGADFIQRPIHPPVLLFVIDVSASAQLSGLTSASLSAIQHSLDAIANSATSTRVGIMTYDAAVHFFSLTPTRSEPMEYVMTDIDDVFVPIPPDEFIVPIADADHFAMLQTLLTMIPSMLTSNGAVPSSSAAFGAAVAAAADALALIGGKIVITQSALPLIGAGALVNRDDSALYGTDKERTLQAPSTSYYQTLATKCAESGVTVDIFVGANVYCDVATTSALADKTGGQIFFYSAFNIRKDGIAFQQDLFHDVTRITGRDAVMIVRCSTGLRVAEQFGAFYHRTAIEMDLATVDSDKTFAVRFEHDGALKDKSEAAIQCALLYTTAEGQRRIRVHTISLPVTNVMANLFRSSDLDAIINISLRQAVRQLLDSTSTLEAQTALTAACIDSLFVYRKHCASQTGAGQLILPEPLKLLPLCTLGIIKHDILQRAIPPDERAAMHAFVNQMPVYTSVAFICPRLYSLHDIPHDSCVPDATGRVFLPNALTLSSDSIQTDGVYLLDDARLLYIFIAHACPQSTLELIFTRSEDTLALRTDGDDFSLSSRVQRLIDTLRKPKAHYQPIQYIQAKAPINSATQPQAQAAFNESLELVNFKRHLIEDSAANSDGDNRRAAAPAASAQSQAAAAAQMSYIDFLCWIHKKIQNKFCKKTTQTHQRRNADALPPRPDDEQKLTIRTSLVVLYRLILSV